MRSCRRILCPIDFSECSGAALAEAVSSAKVFGAELTVLHVYQDPVYPPPMEGFVGLSADVLMRVRADLEERLRALARPLRDEGAVVHTAMVDGAAYRAIIDYAKEWNADLIVMGTHGRTGFAHALTGSVTERVVRLAHCPVLVTRAMK